jgi:predicted nucleic acid-binding protein
VNNYYLDASALVKRYVDEAGSDWVRQIAAPGRDSGVFVSQMVILEVISAFARRMREGSLAPLEFATVRDALWADCFRDYSIIPVSQSLIELACALLEKHPLRAYDATHLATALHVQQFLDVQAYPSLKFVSADDRLNVAAEREGLAVGNPNRPQDRG